MRTLLAWPVLALVWTALPCAAQTQDQSSGVQGTSTSPIPYSPVMPLGIANPYNPNRDAPRAPAFGMGSPAGTRFGPDPKVGAWTVPTDVNGVPNSPTTRTGYDERQYQTTPPAKKKKKKSKTGSQASADPELPAAEAAARQQDQPAADNLPDDDPFSP